MSSKNLWIMTLLFLAGIGLLFLMNVTPIFKSLNIEKNRLDLNEVQAITIEKSGKPHVLNLEQQVQLIKYLNQAVPVEKKVYENQNNQVDFERINITRFNKPEIVITPVAYLTGNLLFSAPAWNPNGYLRDTSDGALQKIITQAVEK